MASHASNASVALQGLVNIKGCATKDVRFSEAACVYGDKADAEAKHLLESGRQTRKNAGRMIHCCTDYHLTRSAVVKLTYLMSLFLI